MATNNTTVHLRLVNESNDRNNTEYVIFQKSVATSFDSLAVAWRVVRFLGTSNYHPFTYSYDLEVGASDSFGNHTPSMDAAAGQRYSMVLTDSGNELQMGGSAASPKDVEVFNGLPSGAINANCYRDGRLLSTKTSIAPAQKAVFQFKPTIFIGAASQIVEGEVLNSAILTDINTQISLIGIASADIVITGGGPGVGSQAFNFRLENVKFF
ncbi:MAG: hypothetical protein AAGN35_13685 [Bacteroidota bacterium]